LSVLLIVYGTLFPFHFDLSHHGLSRAWAGAGVAPFGDVWRGRIHSLPNMVANALLTVPMGFFGFLWFGRNTKTQGERISPKIVGLAGDDPEAEQEIGNCVRCDRIA